jgi:hypothetical protein
MLRKTKEWITRAALKTLSFGAGRGHHMTIFLIYTITKK